MKNKSGICKLICKLIWKESKWKWYMFKIRFDLMSEYKKQKYMKKNYCRYGIHKIYNHSISFGSGGKRMTHIRFIKCRWCNYIFFANKSDKNKYEKYKDDEKKATNNLFGTMKKHGKSAKIKVL